MLVLRVIYFNFKNDAKGFHEVISWKKSTKLHNKPPFYQVDPEIEYCYLFVKASLIPILYHILRGEWSNTEFYNITVVQVGYL